VVLGRNPSVLTDREVQVLKIVRADEALLSAVLFAYATHSTSLGPRNYLVSGDVHGLAAQFLENYFGPDLVAPEFAGASGDIDPWVRVLPEFKSERGWVPEPVLMATLLGEEVAQVVERTQTVLTNGPVRSMLKVLQLPGKPSSEVQAGAAAPTVPFSISVGQVGDIAFVGLGGEVFNELGRAVKSGSPFVHTFIFTHCNGAAGYVPTRASYPEGGYEVQSSPFSPGAGEELAEAAVRMLRELQ
jgi:neutral ceramidase